MASSQELEFIMKMRDEASKVLSGFTKNLNDTGKNASEAGKQLNAMRDGLLGIAKDAAKAAVSFITLKSAVGEYKALKDQLLEIRKATGLTALDTEELGKAMEKLSLKIPLPREKLLQLAQTVAEANISGTENISQFVQAIAKMQISIGDFAGQDIAKPLIRFSERMKLTIPDVERLGSGFGYLDKALSTGSLTDVLDFGEVLSRRKNDLKFTTDQIFALGGALSDAGVPALRAAQGYTLFVTSVQNAVAKGGKELELFAKVSGESAAQFKDDFGKNAFDTLQKFTTGLGQLSGNTQQKVLGAIGANNPELAGILQTLATQAERVKELQAGFKSAENANTDLANRFDLTLQESTSKAILRSNALGSILTGIGEQAAGLIGPFKSAINGAIASTAEFRASLSDTAGSALDFAAALATIASGTDNLKNGLLKILPALGGVSSIGGIFAALGASASGAFAAIGAAIAPLLPFLAIAAAAIGVVVAAYLLLKNTMIDVNGTAVSGLDILEVKFERWGDNVGKAIDFVILKAKEAQIAISQTIESIGESISKNTPKAVTDTFNKILDAIKESRNRTLAEGARIKSEVQARDAANPDAIEAARRKAGGQSFPNPFQNSSPAGSYDATNDNSSVTKPKPKVDPNGLEGLLSKFSPGGDSASNKVKQELDARKQVVLTLQDQVAGQRAVYASSNANVEVAKLQAEYDRTKSGALKDQIAKQIELAQVSADLTKAQAAKDTVKALLDENAAIQLVLDGKAKDIDLAKIQLQLDAARDPELRKQLDLQKKATIAGADAKQSLDDFNARKAAISDGLSDAFTGFITGAKTAKEAVVDLISSLAQLIIKQQLARLATAAVNSFLPAIGAAARGAVLTNGEAMPFARGGVVSQPTYFPMSSGKTGVAGEQGQSEGILPLLRTRNGDLGVQAVGGGGGGTQIQFAPTIQISFDGAGPSNEKQAGDMNDALMKNLTNGIKTIVVQTVQDQLRLGGNLNPGFSR